MLGLSTHLVVLLDVKLVVHFHWKLLEGSVRDHLIDLPITGQGVQQAVSVLRVYCQELLSGLPSLFIRFCVHDLDQVLALPVALDFLHLPVEEPTLVLFFAVS